jgi:hypothetical protein
LDTEKAKIPNTAKLFLWPLTHPQIEEAVGTPDKGHENQPCV